MNPALASVIVLAAAVASTTLTLVVRRREATTDAPKLLKAAVFVWFLSLYTIFAFLVRPH